jgi:hypothetical protein
MVGGCSSDWRSNNTSRAKRNVAHHYDLSGKLYDLFLDSRPPIFLRLFLRAGRNARGSADRQEAAHRGQAPSRPPGFEACSTSARAGAGSRSTSRAIATRTCSASLCRRSNSRLRASVRSKRVLPIAAGSNLRIIATLPARSTASSRSACSNMSASVITPPISPRFASS